MPSIDQFRSIPVVETIGGDRTMVLNMGPQHPSTHGVLRLLLEIDGETIVRVRPDIGFLHTGIEKTCEAFEAPKQCIKSDDSGARRACRSKHSNTHGLRRPINKPAPPHSQQIEAKGDNPGRLLPSRCP